MNKDAKKILKISLVSILFLIILTLVFFNSRELISGVKIRNLSITDGMKVSNSILKVSGVAKNATKITLDDREISMDQKGNFNETISLFPGYNIVKIYAQDKFGNIDEKNYKLIYEAGKIPAQQ